MTTFLAILAILSPAQLVLSAIRGCTEYRARKGLARIMADWEPLKPVAYYDGPDEFPWEWKPEELKPIGG